MTTQEFAALADAAERAYLKASATSNADDWMEAALLAKQHRTAATSQASVKAMREALYEIANRASNMGDPDAAEWMPSIYRIACEASGEDPWPMLKQLGFSKDGETIEIPSASVETATPAQEVVVKPDHRIYFACECCETYAPENGVSPVDDIAVMPDGTWLCSGCYADCEKSAYGLVASDVTDFEYPDFDDLPKPKLYTHPAPAPSGTEALRKPDEITEQAIRTRAKKILSSNGWVFGNRIGYHSVIEMMVRFGMALSRSPEAERCGYPECGCDFDATCNAALSAPAQQAVDAEAVKRLESAIIHANECFEAALVEGWLDALSNGDIEAIRDLWVRRLSWVRDQFPAVLALIGGR